ncbi:hypothetical protein OSTOST_11719 [Ostertagia ostertagi]
MFIGFLLITAEICTAFLNEMPFIDNGMPFKDGARCFSCMSRLYEAVWPSLSHIYKRPRNFTDDCNDDRLAEGRVPAVHCCRYVCRCNEAPHMQGSTRPFVSWYRWMQRDSCRPYRKKELFKLGGDQVDESTIDVCTCYADYCNGNSSATLSTLLISFMITLTYILISIY